MMFFTKKIIWQKNFSSISYYALILTLLMSGLNFLPQFKIGSVPGFQIILLFTVIIFYLKSRSFNIPRLQAVKLYSSYLVFSFIALVIAIPFNLTAPLTYLYTLLPFLLFIFSYQILNRVKFDKLLFWLNISMLGITIIGWMIRIGFIDYRSIYEDILSAEFLLGYWGIRYLESTRNSDYLYPLIGLIISMYFFLKYKKNTNLILIILYCLTLIASLSRAAIVISALAFLILIYQSSAKAKFKLIGIIGILVILNYDTIMNMFSDQYYSILSSIFTSESTESKFSNEDRLQVIVYALESAIINPFGYGIDNYSAIYSVFNIKDRVSNSAENAFLTILIERGWFALITFLLFWKTLFVMAYRNNNMTLNKIALPLLLIYFFFNYELNNIFGCFIFYVLLVDYYLTASEEIRDKFTLN